MDRQIGMTRGTRGVRIHTLAAIATAIALVPAAAPGVAARPPGPLGTVTTGPTACRIVNLTTAERYTSYLSAILDVDTPGTTLTIRGTCAITTGVVITDDLVLRGVRTRRSGPPTLDGAASSAPVVSIAVGRSVQVEGLRIRNGVQGVSNSGSATLRKVTIAGNGSAVDGGGIANSGTMKVIDSLIQGNSTDQTGAGIQNTGTMTVIGSRIIGNDAGQLGGGIGNLGGSLTVKGLTLIAENSAGQYGGGIYSSGTVSTRGSLAITGNTAGIAGGGIGNDGTFSFNGTAELKANSAADGGGISNGDEALLSVNDPIRIHHNTAVGGGGLRNEGILSVNAGSRIDHNTATGDGGGIANSGLLSVNDLPSAGTSTSIDRNTAVNGAGVLNNGTFSLPATARILLNVASASGGGIKGTAGASGLVCAPTAGANVKQNSPDNCVV